MGPEMLLQGPLQTPGSSTPTGRIAEDPLNCAIIAREVGAIQQLILMALSENEVVVEQACKVIGEEPLPLADTLPCGLAIPLPMLHPQKAFRWTAWGWICCLLSKCM